MHRMQTLDLCVKLVIVCVQFSLVIFPLHLDVAEFIVSNQPSKTFHELTDLNLGVLMAMSDTAPDGISCVNKLRSAAHIHLAQAVEYAIKEANEKYKFSKVARMGFVLMDDCFSETQTLTQALAFVPLPKCPRNQTGVNNLVKPYDIIGVIGSSSSPQSIALSNLLTQMEIPVISYTATSDELSDPSVHPYFLRTLPPVKYQFEAISAFIEALNWSYVSIVYDDGEFAENGLKKLRYSLSEKGKCLAAVLKIPTVHSQVQINMIAQALVQKENARAVVVIAGKDTAAKVIKTVSNLLPGNFIWIGTGEWSDELNEILDLREHILGSIVAIPYLSAIPQNYTSYFEQLNPTTTSNPWFIEFWEEAFNCSQAKKTCSANLKLTNQLIPSYINRIIDTVDIYANATKRILNRCLLKSSTNEVRKCITGPDLLREVKKSNQMGNTGTIQINDKGDRIGAYMFLQVVRTSAEDKKKSGILYETVEVASYDSYSGEISMKENLTWEYHVTRNNQSTPESRCSRPCGLGEKKIPQEVSCCWICQRCRPNEYVTIMKTKCGVCPLYHWPDSDTNLTACKQLPVDKPNWTNVSGIIRIILSVTDFCYCLTVLVFFFRFWKRRVIQNSSPALSFLMLLSVGLGGVSIMTLQFEPNEIICRVSFFLFCVSITLLYGPLLLRTLSICHTYDSLLEKGVLVQLLSPVQQVLYSCGLLTIQIAICSMAVIFYPTWHKLTMKVATEPYVELSCDMQELGLALFLVYNLLLLVVSGCLSFKSRNLKDNYNETGYISFFVSTVIVVWSTIIPAYLVTAREYMKMDLLVLILALHHGCAFAFLFLPKVYAVVKFEDDVTVDSAYIRSIVNSSVAAYRFNTSFL